MASILCRCLLPSMKRVLAVPRNAQPRVEVTCCLSGDVHPPPDLDNPPIPTYTPRKNESYAVKKSRLLYQSRKRGMLENGLLLSTFADIYLDQLTESQLDQYDNLINKPSNDWEIYNWIIGKQETPAEYDNEIMTMLKEHAKNKDRVMRNQQPPLKVH